ncbi:MAG TPA: YcnI family protein [Gemmatimonadaceae bacterium]|nr:YcnI family protein [Gemmatimonadaceae bacterium]
MTFSSTQVTRVHHAEYERDALHRTRGRTRGEDRAARRPDYAARRRTLRRTAACVIVLLCALALPASLFAHAVVYPRRSTPGAYEKYVLRVPNEKNVPTTRVEIRFPADVRVVSFADVPGWELHVLTDSAGRVTGAVWTGTLPPARFVEFPFVAVNPRTASRIVWPAFQTYADGDRVEWTGPEESERPASATEIAPATDSGGSRWTLYMSAAALILALIGLGLAARPRSAA